jgi:sodium-dependent dicarboxylate transporter 2/3/5
MDGGQDGGFGTTRRRAAVLAGAAGLAALAYAFPLSGIGEEGRRLTSVLMVVVTFWISEAIPLAATALLGPALCVLLGVASADQAFAAFANPIIFLFIGSFLLARLTFKHRLNERIAYRVLSLPAVGQDPIRAFVFFAFTTAAISAWMSNVAVTAMMLPIAESVLLAIGADAPPPATYAAGLMLIVTYSASVGGLFTPVGTPPNLIGIALIEQATGEHIAFAAWVIKVFPVAAAALAVIIAWFVFLFRRQGVDFVYDRTQMAARYAALGPWRPAERRVAAALLTTAVLWFVPSIVVLIAPAAGTFLSGRLPEVIVPLLTAGVLFWTAEGRGSRRAILELADLAGIDWPVIVLFGGGMCLGQLMTQTGMATALGQTLAAHVPMSRDPALVFIFCLLAIAVSETTSNTASANMVVPVAMAVSKQVGVDALAVGLAATVACTFGFMLPVSTPTNAMAYATGYVPQRQMIRYGIVLDAVGILLLSLWFGWVV